MRQIKKILILSANPQNTNRRRLDEEVREIDEGLRRSKKRDQFKIYQKWAIRLRDLRRAMLDYEPQIVHFCGHGEENGLMVEDETGSFILVAPKALANLFGLFATHLECVLLNACYSKKQAEAINEHINYVIGMNKVIHDKTMIEFTVGFYDALGAGKTIEEAFRFGCNAIQLKSYKIPEDLYPVLLKRPLIDKDHADSDRYLQKFITRPGGQTAELTVASPELAYDVAISYASEDKNYAEALAECLIKKGIKVFYDSFEQPNLWGKDLYTYLHDVYSRHARFCVMFISEAYVREVWASHERRAAQERAINEKEREYILPIRLDDTKVPGLSDNIGYVHVRSGISRICDMLHQKISYLNK